MPPFVVSCDTPLPPLEAWNRVTDWPRHGDHVPLTTVTVRTPPPAGLGTVFRARTALGPAHFDDVMEVVIWRPPAGDEPGHCRLHKRGRVVLGWAEIAVESRPEGGSIVTWREQAKPAHLPAFTDAASAAVGRRLFGRVLRGLLAAP